MSKKKGGPPRKFEYDQTQEENPPTPPPKPPPKSIEKRAPKKKSSNVDFKGSEYFQQNEQKLELQQSYEPIQRVFHPESSKAKVSTLIKVNIIYLS